MRPRAQDAGEERKGRIRFIVPPRTANLTRPKSVNSLLFAVQDEMRDGYCSPNQIIFYCLRTWPDFSPVMTFSWPHSNVLIANQQIINSSI